MSAPVYQPVASAEGEIRLLILLPASNHDADIQCELKTARLSDKPTFEALSYTWGSIGKADEIRLNGHKFPVWENAGAALRQLRLPKKSRHLWVDAICINQDDLQERSEQVLLMQQIYGQAEQVCVWLGELTDGGIVGMKELQNKVWSVGWHQFKIDRKYGKPTLPWTEQFTTSRGIMNRSALVEEQSNREVREILDRPWWRRTWIIQEAVLAQKIIIMIGSEATTWESIDAFFRRIAWTTDRMEVFGLPVHEKDLFPDRLYRTISDFREKWHSSPDTVKLLDVLYRFRQLECSNASDKIYGFLGIIPEVVDMGLVPDYRSTVADVYRHFARQHIDKTTSLDVLNCKREWQGARTASATMQAYSILDQAKYYDVHALIEDAPGKAPRRGWARLPDGWERIPNGNTTLFKDNKTGLVLEKSPLEGLTPCPAEYYTKQRALPPGWTKRWDNIGCQTVDYGVEQTEEEKSVESRKDELRHHLSTLPSWVPNWAFPTAWDPEPLIAFDMSSRQYWAAGDILPHVRSESDSHILSLDGLIFDTIEQLSPAWHPETDVAPISRKGSKTLLAWEELGTADRQDCPYNATLGRTNALWRTMIGDKAGDEAAPDDERFYVETWYDRVGWAKDQPDLTSLGPLDATLVEQEMKGLENEMLYHFVALNPSRYPEFGEKLRQSNRDGEHIIKRYGEYMRRIHRVCAHRALFVTKMGYIGLAPWNAREGDEESEQQESEQQESEQQESEQQESGQPKPWQQESEQPKPWQQESGQQEDLRQGYPRPRSD
ncbi:HET-domain-containing protein [Coniochaeta ligniaria NRRL 30616]|uniref:HET-domain-containing protein n=1 Tax=Coniochaeta ligniaria NRRL 30616 TaxID=1408157 RepID=A0A1J7IYE0_9PEZI|nr:HET-domain-containing protein [Coniochaeta ligniaria NRRL 30616]